MVLYGTELASVHADFGLTRYIKDSFSSSSFSLSYSFPLTFSLSDVRRRKFERDLVSSKRGDKPRAKQNADRYRISN